MLISKLVLVAFVLLSIVPLIALELVTSTVPNALVLASVIPIGIVEPVIGAVL